jgi:hypothetical protein
MGWLIEQIIKFLAVCLGYCTNATEPAKKADNYIKTKALTVKEQGLNWWQKLIIEKPTRNTTPLHTGPLPKVRTFDETKPLNNRPNPYKELWEEM